MSRQPISPVSAVRRKAEMMFNKSLKRQPEPQDEQRRAQEELAEKTARLRELRLAKEAAEKTNMGATPPSTD